jgi:hypothetical protein
MRTLVLLCAMGLTVEAAVGVRVILGLTDRAETKWDGSVKAEGARVTAVEGWRFEGADEVTGTSWRASTHRIRLFGGGRAGQPPFTANGVVVWLDGETESTQLTFQTAQGGFAVKLADIPFGRRASALEGRVMADRVPGSTQIAKGSDEQDYPAAAVDKNGGVWLTYVEFRHNKDHHQIRANYNEKPDNFDDMQAPTGGDHIVLTKVGGGTPINVTEPGGDVYRPAIVVDGNGRVWVFWSQNDKGNFDLYARAYDSGKPAPAIRVGNAPGSDVFPAAATDSSGRVWVAWQGWRDGRARIFAASQQGAKFGAPVEISQSPANEWNPTLAADSSGRVTAVWDSYRNGTYDVYLRTHAAGKWQSETAVAATANYEAYPSAAYDGTGRLWIAYEEGGPGWGKDWGAYETSGISLYQARAIRLLAFDAAGARFTPAAFDSAMPGIPEQRIDTSNTQADPMDFLQPNPESAGVRRPSATPLARRGPKNTLPRVAIDSSGRVWLVFRSSHPVWWNPIGTVWSEYVVSCSGSQCTGPVYLMHSDNLLDNRPAVVSTAAGKLVVINSSDGRRRFAGPAGARGARARRQVVEDPYQNDLWMHEVSLGPGSAVAVRAAAAPATPWKDPADAAEIAQRQRLAAHRIGSLRIVRGEFHRHSEISADGGNDGSIIDQWRYMLDPGHMDWVGCCDHDNGGGREYSWWTTQKLTDIFHTPGRFVPMFSYERSVPYPEGHRNVVFAQRGIRPLPRLPRVDENTPGKAPDTLMFYEYLRRFNGIAASHTSGTNMGTDWRDNDPLVEPVVEIYQGDRQNYERPGAPRTNSAEDSIGGWRPKGFVSLALEMGYKLGFQASSDHISTHMSYCNLLAADNSREAILDAFRKRHIYGATDDILADVRSGSHIMGDIFETETPPELQVRLVGTAPFAKVHIVRDNEYVYSVEPKTAEVTFRWRDAAPRRGRQSYYYVRGEQADGEVVWVSPMWITYK